MDKLREERSAIIHAYTHSYVHTCIHGVTVISLGGTARHGNIHTHTHTATVPWNTGEVS